MPKVACGGGNMVTYSIGLVAALAAAAICIFTSSCSCAEVRGAWITSWSPGFFTKQEVDETIAAAEKAGINLLLPEVRKCADAYYNSHIEPRGPEIAPDFDPLAYMIEQAHARGMQVHAWLVIYRVWAGKNEPTDPNNIVLKHPDWINLNSAGSNRAGEGIYLDPGVPEVREYLVSVVEDIVKHYNVDGIHYDYIRYPGKDWGYSERALSRYYAETGETKKPESDNPRWQQWRRDQVTELVKMIREKVRSINPNVAISASTIPWGNCPVDWTEASPYTTVYQDWKRWMEQGLLDANVPMNYRTESNPDAAKSYRVWLDGFKRWSGGGTVWVGMDANQNSAENILKQAEAARLAGHQGFVLFSFNQGEKRTEKAALLGASLAPAPKLPVNPVNGLDYSRNKPE